MNNEKKRIIIVTDMLEMGGIESYVMNYIRHIDMNRFQIDFIRSLKKKGPFDKELKSYGCRFFYLEDSHNIIDVYRHITQFKRIIRRIRPDIIHFHCCVSYSCYDAFIAKICGVKKIIVHSHTSSVIGTQRAFLHKLMRIPVSLIATDRISCSDVAGNWMFGRFNYTVINNGIDIKRFEYNEAVRSEVRFDLGVGSEFLIGAVGRLTKVKNHLFLIELLDRLRKKGYSVKLLIIGDGEFADKLLQEVNNKKCSDSFIWIKSTCEIYKYYNAMDAFLMPSLFEGLPISGVEAQTANLPCLFSNNISKEVVLSSLSKLLPIEDIDLWLNSVIEIMNSKQKRIVEIAPLIESGYSINAMAEAISRIYLCYNS